MAIWMQLLLRSTNARIPGLFRWSRFRNQDRGQRSRRFTAARFLEQTELEARVIDAVAISITTLDESLARDLEPRTSSPQARLRAIQTLSDAGVPTRIMTAPVIPGMNDHEIPGLRAAAAKAGATSAGYVMLRLPGSVAPVFDDWLSTIRPDLQTKVLDRIRDVRAGEINDSQFGRRMRGTGPRADSIADMFRMFVKKHRMSTDAEPLRQDLFQPPIGRDGQLHLF